MSAARFTLGPARDDERAGLLRLAVETGRFDAQDAASLLGGIFDAHARDTAADGHEILVIHNGASDTPAGWTYFAADPYADGVWNIWWIGVHPTFHGHDAGTQLLQAVEGVIAQAGARVIVIETSALPALARARRFYEREGYGMRGTIPDYYGDGDGKVIFSKRLAATN